MSEVQDKVAQAWRDCIEAKENELLMKREYLAVLSERTSMFPTQEQIKNLAKPGVLEAWTKRNAMLEHRIGLAEAEYDEAHHHYIACLLAWHEAILVRVVRFNTILEYTKCTKR